MSDWEVAATQPAAQPKGGGWDVVAQRPARPPVDSPLKQALTAPLAPGEAALNLITGAFAKPLSDVAGMAAIPMHAMGMDRDPARVRDQVASALTYEPHTTQGQLATENNPLALLGRLFSGAGDMAEHAVAPPQTSGPLRSAIGSGVGEVVRQLPAFTGLAAAKAAPLVTAGGRRLMQSAIKPTWADLKTGDAGKAITTMLDRGLNVSPGGVGALESGISDLNTQISGRLANSTKSVGQGAVASRLDDLAQRLTQQATPQGDLAAVAQTKNEFMAHPAIQGPAIPGQEIPIQQAQAMKQGTYRALGDKAYNEVGSASRESQKTLARGLKEEVASAEPSLAPLNAEESQLLNAKDVVERGVLTAGNKNPIGLGALHPSSLAFWLADRSPLVKSLLARTMANGVAPALPAAPAVGVIVEGHRFKGGNPNDQASWEPIQ